MSAHISDVSHACSLSNQQIHSLLKPHEDIFIMNEDYITYKAPFDIKDKISFRKAIETAFPKGIPYKHLQFCYEFCELDFNEMLYEDCVHIHKFGKTEEIILFKKYTECQPNIHDLWYDAS